MAVSIGGATALVGATAPAFGGASWRPGTARAALVIVVAVAAVAGVLATDAATAARATANAGEDLTRLLRSMAVIKTLMTAGATAAVVWRLGAAVAPLWWIAYAATCGAMAAAPGLIWGMAHVGLGATMLHGGLLAAVLLLWRDPVVGERLGALVGARRAALRGGVG